VRVIRLRLLLRLALGLHISGKQEKVPEVVVVSDVVLATFRGDSLWITANQTRLPVVAEDVPRDSDIIASLGDIDEPIVVVKTVFAITPELIVVDPDVIGEGG
jgi:hypothetical protein